MSTWVGVLFFVVGIVLVVKGGDIFVDAASWIARAANIPTFIVGATIVSFATTLPELIVSVMASAEGKNDMAVGNAVGSVTANTGLIMAVAFIFMVVVASRKQYWKQCVLLVAAAGVLWLGCSTGVMQAWASVVLFIIFVLFLGINVQAARQEPEQCQEEAIEKSPRAIAKNVVLFVVGAGLIVLGSNLLIEGGSAIAVALGVPERVIAVTMVAIGTSLPELVTTLTAIKKKESHLSIGNIIGANIIDLSLILPICSLVGGQQFAVSAQSLQVDFPVCMLLTLMAVVPLLVRQKGSRVQGVLMLAVYVVYLIAIV
jgi:cation:H+ antiporter